MAYSTRAIHGTLYHYIRMYDDWGLPDAIAMFRELAATYPSLSGNHIICDVRDGRVTLSLSEVFELVDVFRRHIATFAGMRWVVLVPGILEYGIAHSCGMMAAGQVPFDFSVTLNPDIACTWAGIPIDALEQWRAESRACAA